MLIGHSYVRDLENLQQHSFSAENITFHIKYVHQPGGTYELFVNNPVLLDPAFEFEPDFVVVVLAGNSLHNSVTNAEVYQHCRSFYQLVRDRKITRLNSSHSAKSRMPSSA